MDKIDQIYLHNICCSLKVKTGIHHILYLQQASIIIMKFILATLYPCATTTLALHLIYYVPPWQQVSIHIQNPPSCLTRRLKLVRTQEQWCIVAITESVSSAVDVKSVKRLNFLVTTSHFWPQFSRSGCGQWQSISCCTTQVHAGAVYSENRVKTSQIAYYTDDWLEYC